MSECFLKEEEKDQLAELCRTSREEHPEWVNRLKKAYYLVHDGQVVMTGFFTWRVKGSAGWHEVQLTPEAGQCDCEWAKLRKETCSHVLASKFWFEIFCKPMLSLVKALARPSSKLTSRRF